MPFVGTGLTKGRLRLPVRIKRGRPPQADPYISKQVGLVKFHGGRTTKRPSTPAPENPVVAYPEGEALGVEVLKQRDCDFAGHSQKVAELGRGDLAVLF